MKLKVNSIVILIVFLAVNVFAIDFSAFKGLRKKEDKVNGVTWARFTSKDTPSKNFRPLTKSFDYDNSMFYLFIMVKDNQEAFLHMHVQVEPVEDWLKFNKVIITGDGVTFEREFVINLLESTLAQGNQYIESYTVEVMEHEVPLLQKIAESKEVTIEYKGESRSQNVKLDKKQLKSMKEILDIWGKLHPIK